MIYKIYKRQKVFSYPDLNSDNSYLFTLGLHYTVIVQREDELEESRRHVHSPSFGSFR